MNNDWEALAAGVYRCRLAFCDVTVGLVLGRDGVLLIDSGTTFDEARSIDADVRLFDSRGVTHLVLTHDHFDHVLGSSVFASAAVHAMPQVATTMAYHSDYLREHAVSYGASREDIDAVVAAIRIPQHLGAPVAIDLGDRVIDVEHPGPGHTDHDLVVKVPPLDPMDETVLFCGDLVEESDDPSIETTTDLHLWPITLERVLEIGGPNAIYVPGHGAVVDADFIGRQQQWLRDHAWSGGSHLAGG